MSGVVEINGLSKYYGKKRGAEDVTFTVESGEIFGFLGPNGAGKSTTIRCLLGLMRPTAGSVRVLGMDMPKARREAMRRVGYLPSETAFYPSMTAGEVIAFAARVRGTDCRAQAARLCEALELDTAKRISEMSLGNRKKVGVVCAMQHEPELLVLDEPTSGLDPLIQERFFELLTERRSRGAACLLSSHVLSEVKKYCDRAAMIREGRIIRVDAVEALTKSSVRRVRLEGLSGLPELEGVHSLTTGNGSLCFDYDGDISALIRALAPLDVRELYITEPELEETFMHFYRDGEQSAEEV